jgi:hypothetical protein
LSKKADGMKRQVSAGWKGKSERVAVLLVEGKTIRAAASEAGVGERTLYTWLADNCFQNHISELRARMLDASVGRLVDAATDAVDTLVALLDAESGGLRLRAAIAILDGLTRMREHVDYERRLTELETDHAFRAESAARSPRSIETQTNNGSSEPD